MNDLNPQRPCIICFPSDLESAEAALEVNHAGCYKRIDLYSAVRENWQREHVRGLLVDASAAHEARAFLRKDIEATDAPDYYFDLDHYRVVRHVRLNDLESVIVGKLAYVDKQNLSADQGYFHSIRDGRYYRLEK